MNWRLMWRGYLEFVTEIVPVVLGMATASIVFVGVISIALAIVRW